MCRYFILFLVCILCLDINAYELKLYLSGKKYETVTLAYYLFDGNINKTNGVFDNKDDSWTFLIPDSLVGFVSTIGFSTSYDEINNEKTSLEFKSLLGTDTVVFRHNVLDPNVKSIYAEYLSTTDKSEVFIKGRLGKLSFDSYLMKMPESEDWVMQAKYPIFSFFSPQKENEQAYEYEDFLKQYASVVRENPNSAYLLNFVYMGRMIYKTKDDLLKVCSGFSDSILTTKCGVLLQDFLGKSLKLSEFENAQLLNNQTNSKEWIIQDTTKYNLVVFSASWCGPCHALLPDLKKIYNDLGKDLIITYISLDEQSAWSNWNNWMRKEAVTWRCLLVDTDLDTVKDRYYAYSIPRMLLISPGGKVIRKIDIREQKDRLLLYELFTPM